MKIQLYKDGKPVQYVEEGHGIIIYGEDINSRKYLVSYHYIDPKDLKPGVSFRSGGSLWEVKHHPKFFSLD